MCVYVYVYVYVCVTAADDPPVISCGIYNSCPLIILLYAGTLLPYGSSVTGLGFKSSDIDLCLDVGDDVETGKTEGDVLLLS